VVKMLQSTMPSTVTIETKLDQNIGNITADPTQIHQILFNLCTNGLHAMEGEKGVLSISLYGQEITTIANIIGGVLPGSYIVLEVRDTGQGMDEETQKLIFDPFFTTKEVGKGTGMGLSVIQGIVKDYKGFIDVKSRVGNGSTFKIYLPTVEETVLPPPALAEETVERKDIHGSEEILIVDDDPSLVRIHGRVLRKVGYQVTEITSSKEALEKVRKAPRRFDLLITDQTMPQLTGAELAEAVIKINPHISVIMCTGHSSVISQKDALAMGISRYVFKPVKRMDFVDSVREVLDEKKRILS